MTGCATSAVDVLSESGLFAVVFSRALRRETLFAFGEDYEDTLRHLFSAAFRRRFERIENWRAFAHKRAGAWEYNRFERRPRPGLAWYTAIRGPESAADTRKCSTTSMAGRPVFTITKFVFFTELSCAMPATFARVHRTI